MELNINENAPAEANFREVSAACAEAVLLISQDAKRLESEVYKPDESWCVVTGEDPPDFNMAIRRSCR